MKIINETKQTAIALTNVCRASCQKLLAQIEKTKESILAEFRQTLATQEQLLRLAVNEAEALAWQTAYPQLVFPALALEKAQAVADWDAHQRSIRRAASSLSAAG